MASRLKHVSKSKDDSIGPSEEGKQAMTSMIPVIFISLVLDLLSFTIILPLMPSLIEYYKQNDQSGLYRILQNQVQSFRELVGAPDVPHLNVVLFGGLIGSLFSFLQFLSSPLIGAASDVYGRKYMMLICLIGTCFSYSLWAVSSNFTIFVISRIVGGISKGNISLSTAIITDVTTQRTRVSAMAVIGIAYSIGFLVGPLIGAFFAHLQRGSTSNIFIVPAIFAMILTLLNILYCMVFFKETLPQSKRLRNIDQSMIRVADHIRPMALFQFRAVKKLGIKELYKLQRLGFIYFLYLFFFSGLEFTLTFLTHIRFKYSSMNQGMMFLYIGLIMSIVQGGFVRRIPSGKAKMVALIGLAIIIPAFMIIGLANSSTMLFLGLLFFSIASATVVPSLTAIVSNYGFDDQKGTVMGIFRSLGALARSLGPILASVIYWSIGVETCYIIGGLSLIIPFILLATLQIT